MDLVWKYFFPLERNYYQDYFNDVERYSTNPKPLSVHINIWIYHIFTYACMAHFIFPLVYGTNHVTDLIFGGYHRFLPDFPREGYILCTFLYILDIPFFEYLYTAQHFKPEVRNVYKFIRLPWQNNLHVVLFDNWYSKADRKKAFDFMSSQFLCICGNRK